ncbi:MAG TPA: hypothetical protein VK986_00455, partial [Tepidisphaeraceae bacterium]|nr:hypothetical protein [Tepidisphaeraceae bacterium]
MRSQRSTSSRLIYPARAAAVLCALVCAPGTTGAAEPKPPVSATAARDDSSRTLPAHGGDWIPALALSPDGKLLLTGGDDQLAVLWDLAAGKPVRTLPKHDSGVTAVAFVPGMKHVLTGTWDGTLAAYDA